MQEGALLKRKCETRLCAGQLRSGDSDNRGCKARSSLVRVRRQGSSVKDVSAKETAGSLSFRGVVSVPVRKDDMIRLDGEKAGERAELLIGELTAVAV